MNKKWLLRKISNGLVYFFVFNCSILNVKAEPVVKREKNYVCVKQNKFGDWNLLLNGKPYFVKGVVYNTYKIGEDPGLSSMRDWMYMDDNQNKLPDGPYDAFVDKNYNNQQDKDEPSIGDFALLQKMGCNTIRLYHHASNEKEMQKLYNHPTLKMLYNHEPNKKLLRELYYRYGIMTIVGDFMGACANGSGATWETGTDYRDPIQRANMMTSVKQMVLDFKEEPFLLMYCLGNENNLPSNISHCNAGQYLEAYISFVKQVADMVRKLDPNHPIMLCFGDSGSFLPYKRLSKSIDIFGINSYRGPNGFGGLWEKVKQEIDKPVLITEYGASYATKGENLEENQVVYHRGCWQDIMQNKAGGNGDGNAIGGIVFEWLDNWWSGGSPFTFEKEMECVGIASQGDGLNSPYLRQLRKVYFYYKKIWNLENE